MLALVLTLLALAGGSIATFFIMDGRRRRAMELRGRLEEERELVRQDHWDNEDRARRLAAQVSELRDARDSLDRQMAEFDRRAITYDDLAAENRLIKSDLKNMALLVAQREQHTFETSQSQATLSQQRDLLAHAYLEEVRASTRKALTATNYPASKRRLEEAIHQLESAGVRPTEAGQRQMMDELHQLYQTAVRAAVEREKQAQIREQIREEARAERDRQAAIEEAERERRAIEKALNDALNDVTGRHAAEIELLRKQLAEAEEKTVRTISLAQITKSGFVYVISNWGSFGKDVFKIGMTRRLDPMDRVWELGDASVPFPFDVHMMITCDDAPALERALHKAFHKKRLNKVNPRKEFFRVTFDEILQVVRENHGEVSYKADAEALEYLQSQSMTEEEMEEVEEVFEEVEEMAGATTDEDN
jgi:Meiotically up-regulated gene 113